MLETELRRGQLDDGLIEEMETMLANGIGYDVRSQSLRDRLDALRETLLTPRPHRTMDGVRSCQELKHAIQTVMSGLR